MDGQTSNLLPIDVIVLATEEHQVDGLATALASTTLAASRTVLSTRDVWPVALAAGASYVAEAAGSQPNTAFMRAVRASSQPYVLLMSGSDELSHGALVELHAGLFRNTHAIAAVGQCEVGESRAVWPSINQARLLGSPLGRYAMLFGDIMPAHGPLLLRRRALLQIPGGLLVPGDATGWHTALKIRLSGGLHVVPRPLCRYEPGELPGSAPASSPVTLLNTAETTLERTDYPLRLVDKIATRYREKHGNAASAQKDEFPTSAITETETPSVTSSDE